MPGIQSRDMKRRLLGFARKGTGTRNIIDLVGGLRNPYVCPLRSVQKRHLLID